MEPGEQPKNEQEYTNKLLVQKKKPEITVAQDIPQHNLKKINNPETGRGFFTRIKEKGQGILEYRRVDKELRNAWRSVSEQREEQTHDENGNKIHGGKYLGGLKLNGELTSEDAIRSLHQLKKELGTQLKAWDDREERQGLVDPLKHFGIINPVLSLPIVPIPEVSYDKKGMSKKQIEELQELQKNVAHAGSVMLQINIQDGSLGGGMAFSNTPEGLGGLDPEDKADTKVQIAMTPGFRGQKQTAEIIYQIIKKTTSIEKKKINELTTDTHSKS